MKRPNYEQLDYLEGTEIRIVHGLSWFGNFEWSNYPERAIFIKDYKKTVMIELQFEKFRKQWMVPKALLFCGDICFKDEFDNLYTGENILIQSTSVRSAYCEPTWLKGVIK